MLSNILLPPMPIREELLYLDPRAVPPTTSLPIPADMLAGGMANSPSPPAAQSNPLLLLGQQRAGAGVDKLAELRQLLRRKEPGTLERIGDALLHMGSGLGGVAEGLSGGRVRNPVTGMLEQRQRQKYLERQDERAQIEEAIKLYEVEQREKQLENQRQGQFFQTFFQFAEKFDVDDETTTNAFRAFLQTVPGSEQYLRGSGIDPANVTVSRKGEKVTAKNVTVGSDNRLFTDPLTGEFLPPGNYNIEATRKKDGTLKTTSVERLSPPNVFERIDPTKYTPDSVKKFEATGKHSDLVPLPKEQQVHAPGTDLFNELKKKYGSAEKAAASPEWRQFQERETQSNAEKRRLRSDIWDRALSIVKAPYTGTFGSINLQSLGKTDAERNQKFHKMISDKALELALQYGFTREEWLAEPTPPEGGQRPVTGGPNIPDAAQYKGKIARDPDTGLRYRSDGKQWVLLNEGSEY